jgi:hypothetical protein
VPQQRAYIEGVIGTIRRECLGPRRPQRGVIVSPSEVVPGAWTRHANSFVDGEGHGGKSVQPPGSGRVVAVPLVARPRAPAKPHRAEGAASAARGVPPFARCAGKERAT